MGRSGAPVQNGQLTAGNGPDGSTGDEKGSQAETATRGDRAGLATFLALEGVALVYLMAVGRRLWFTGDEWEFLANRTAFSWSDLTRAHAGAHLVPLPILVYRLLWWVFGLRTYFPYQLLVVGLH